jgi:hypothetical protein
MSINRLFHCNLNLTNLIIDRTPSLCLFFDHLGHALTSHPTLARLTLTHNGLFEGRLNLGDFFNRLSTCPKLQAMNFQRNEFTANGLDVFISHPLPPTLTTLDLRGNPFDDQVSANKILEIVEGCPALCFVLYDVSGPAIQAQIQHATDLNQSGKYLLGDNVRPALWPFVLERASLFLFEDVRPIAQIPARRSNALFHLLQGPALLQAPREIP